MPARAIRYHGGRDPAGSTLAQAHQAKIADWDRHSLETTVFQEHTRQGTARRPAAFQWLIEGASGRKSNYRAPTPLSTRPRTAVPQVPLVLRLRWSRALALCLLASAPWTVGTADGHDVGSQHPWSGPAVPEVPPLSWPPEFRRDRRRPPFLKYRGFTGHLSWAATRAGMGKGKDASTRRGRVRPWHLCPISPQKRHETGHLRPRKTRFTRVPDGGEAPAPARSFRNGARYFRNGISVYREQPTWYFGNEMTVLEEQRWRCDSPKDRDSVRGRGPPNLLSLF